MAGGAGRFEHYGQSAGSLLQSKPVTPGYRKYKSHLQGSQYSCLFRFGIGLGPHDVLLDMCHGRLKRIAFPLEL